MSPRTAAGYSDASLAKKLGIKPGFDVLLVDPPKGWEVPELPEGSRLAPDAALWIAWPRRTGGHSSDISDSLVRGGLLSTGVVDVKVAALDDDWSGLKFVWRSENRVNRPNRA